MSDLIAKQKIDNIENCLTFLLDFFKESGEITVSSRAMAVEHIHMLSKCLDEIKEIRFRKAY